MAYGGSGAQKLRQLVWEERPHICHLCMKPVVWEEYSLDHLISRSHGGTDDLDNCFVSHKRCNYSRQDRPIEDFRATNTNNSDWLFKLTKR